jgi:hypothetical protein
MKTAYFKFSNWFIIALGIGIIIYSWHINIFKQVNKIVEREQFEAFITAQIASFLIDTEAFELNEKSVDKPDMAALQDYLMTMDPELKRVPRERLKEAYAITKGLQNKQSLKSTSQLEWQNTAANMGGRTRDIMWDPNDPDGKKAWAGCVTGGLWYNQDVTSESSSWIPVDDFWPTLSISSITYDPNEPETFYVGTGEAQTALIIYRESSGLGFGIMKSTNAGVTWDVIPFTESFAYVTDVEVKDENGVSAIYATVASGIYMGAQYQSSPTDGLWRSVDGGDNWDQVLPDIPGHDSPYAGSDIEIGPDGRIYIGTMPNLSGDGGATILYSDEGIAGTWTVNDEYKTLIEGTPGFNLPGRVMLASAPSDENYIYALIAQGYFNGLPGYECHIIAKSTNKGEDWSMVSLPPNDPNAGNWAFIAWHALTASVNPSNPQLLYAGGLDLNRSINGGDNWNVISDWLGMYSGGAYDYIHGDIHRVLFKPGSDHELIISTDGGIFYSSNILDDYPVFEERNMGFNTLQTYKCAISPIAASNNYLAGFQDNCTVIYGDEPVTINDILTGGDGASCFWDKNEPELFITSSQYNRYSVYINGVMSASINNMASGNFISSADYDYKLNNLFANAAWFHTFSQDSILRISGLPYNINAEFVHMGTGSTLPFTHVKYSPHSLMGQSTLFLGTQSGRLFKAEQANTDPIVTEIGSPNFPTGTISCVAIGGSDDTLLVTFSNYGVSSVWQSYDGSQSWQEKESNLPDMPIRWAIYHPSKATAAMLATEMGVWTSYNLAEDIVDWLPDNNGLANVRVDMLQLRDADNTVIAGSHGRGLYSTTYDYNPTTNISQKTYNKLNIYPNPTTGLVNINHEVNNSYPADIHIFNASNVLVRSFQLKFSNNMCTINITDLKSGTYLVKLITSNAISSGKIIKQ